MYAIVRTGGKQYRVEEGRSIQVERLPGEEGSRLELKDVLLIADDDEVTVGAPTIEGARVMTQVESHGRDKKIIVFKFKAKVRTRKKTGHRQSFTRLAIEEILRPGQEPKKIEKPKARQPSKAAKAADEAEAEAPTATSPETEADEAATPKRSTRAKAADEKGSPSAKAKTPAKRAPAKRKTAKRAAGKATTDAPDAKAGDDDAGDAPDKETPPKATRRKTAQKKTDEDKD